MGSLCLISPPSECFAALRESQVDARPAAQVGKERLDGQREVGPGIWESCVCV